MFVVKQIFVSLSENIFSTIKKKKYWIADWKDMFLYSLLYV